MEFNKIVKTLFLPILKKHGFEILEEFKNIVRFQSPIMNVNLIYNEHDKSYFAEFGSHLKTLYPLNNKAVKEIWKEDALPVEHVTPRIFIQNLSLLFETKEGIEILKGNTEPLKKNIGQQSEKYTSELLRKQLLDAASRSWDKGDFTAFVERIEQIGADIPQSYLLKYKIARQKMQ